MAVIVYFWVKGILFCIFCVVKFFRLVCFFNIENGGEVKRKGILFEIVIKFINKREE